MKKTVEKPLKIIGNVLIWLFVAFSIFVSIIVFTAKTNADGITTIGGKFAINVLTESMEPTINAGDLIISRELSADDKQSLKEDDIITFHDKRITGDIDLNTHRIIKIERNADGIITSIITRGDNPKIVEDDPSISTYDVVAVYDDTRFPLLGYLMTALKNTVGFFLIIILPLIIFFIYELIRFVLTLTAVRNSKKNDSTISAEDEERIKQKAIEEYLAMQEADKNKLSSDEKPPVDSKKTDTGTDESAVNDSENN